MRSEHLVEPVAHVTQPKPVPGWTSVVVAAGFAVAAAAALSPFFFTSFAVLVGRTTLLAAAILAAFIGAQRWPESRLPRGVPRWMLTVLLVGVTAPVGTLLVYLAAVDGRPQDLLGDGHKLSGLLIISGTGLCLGLLITLVAMLRERDAHARMLALEMQLQRSRLDQQSAAAQLALLQAQIEPHFLFNTLSNIQALVDVQSPRAPAVLKSLTAYLRAAIPRLQDDGATLADEMSLVRAYLELMQMRMPDRLRWSINLDPALSAHRFPAMAMLTLVENAVRHGIDPSEAGGCIEVGVERDALGVRAWVADDGAGMPDHAQPGAGLTNLRARMTVFFPGTGKLSLQERQPRGLLAELRWASPDRST